jgi:hypothetical protein
VDESEIDCYFQEPRIPWNTASVTWCKLHSGRSPNLAAVARDYLSSSASSVPAERHFSDAGERRLSLFPALLLVLDHKILDTLTTTTIHYSLVIPYSLFPIHYSLFPIHYSLSTFLDPLSTSLRCSLPSLQRRLLSPVRFIHFFVPIPSLLQVLRSPVPPLSVVLLGSAGGWAKPPVNNLDQ